MARIFTSLCKKHPELGGERHSHNRTCVGCTRESNVARAKRRYEQDSEYRGRVIRAVVEHGRSNAEARRVRSNRSYAKNKESYAPQKAARGRVRRHHVTCAQPPWMKTAELAAVYARARESGMTVDHIVPIHHPLVCGLHVPWNLQLMSARDNFKKGNKFDVSAN